MESLLVALEHAPLTPIQTLSTLPVTERSELLQGFNAEPTTPESALTIHQRIEQHAQHQPNAVAVQVGDQRLTYSKLNHRANALAHHLIGLGVRPDDRVAVLARRGLETLCAMLAVLKAGASYVRSIRRTRTSVSATCWKTARRW